MNHLLKRHVLCLAVPLLLAGVALLLAGCGGISTQPGPGQTTTTVVVEVLLEGTTDLLPVVADIVVGGVRGQTDLEQGWAIITGVPLGTSDPPEQPLTVMAAGYVTVSQMVGLSAYSYTPVNVEMAPADPQQTATVQGAVTDSGTGAPVVNALVTFARADGSGAVAGFTDQQGAYKLGGVPAGAVQGQAQASGYLQGEADVTLLADAAGSNAAVNLALLNGSTKITVTGQVVRLGLETPVAGAQVAWADAPPVTTGSDGTFSLAQVTVGPQTLVLTASGYDEKQLTVEILPGMAPLLVLLVPASPEPPGQPSTIRGHVTLLGKSDNAGATVTAREETSGEVLDTAVTNAAGDYSLFVPPGNYRLTVQYQDRSIGRDVILRSGGRVLSGIDFTLTVL